MTRSDTQATGSRTGRDVADQRRWTSDIQGKPGRRAALFLWPCLAVLALYIIYPLVFSAGRSLFDASGEEFVGLGNYVEALSDERTGIAFRNNLIWVLVAPTLVTALGMLFAVLTERIKWSVAFRLVLFMPLAISLFASGVIFRLVYDEDPELGVANAAAVTVHDLFTESSEYPGVQPRDDSAFTSTDDGYISAATFGPGDSVHIPMVGMRPGKVPPEAQEAASPSAQAGELRGAVWLDVSAGGRPEVIEPAESGMPRVTIHAVKDGAVAATTTTTDDGSFILPDLPPGNYALRLAGANFTEPFNGMDWLGPELVTPVIISAWIWIMTGFAMTFIAAGLAAIPRDALEAARVDGATESQVFKRVTFPLLAPMLLVVFVTLVINVLKIFDLVYVVAPGSSQAEANVLALLMWQVSFGAGGDQGMGSALAILLFLLVVPAIVFNVRRFRKARSG